jgi:signal transduction histidine kinase
MSAITDRISRIDPATADRLLVAAMILGVAAETAAYADGDAGRVAVAGLLAAAIATLVVRRSHPVVPLVLIMLAVFAVAGFESDFFSTTAFPFLAVMVALYSVARHTPGPRGIWICVAAIAFAAGTSLLQNELDGPGQYLWLMLLCGAPTVAGRTLLNRSRIQDELRDRTQELEREGELRSSRAVEDERVRIASELQAVVANGVSAMVVQAEAVPRVIAAGETERAAESLALIEETGRDALAEMRRLLGVLRHDGERGALEPQPTLAQAGRLVEQARARGLEVSVEVEGQRVTLPAGVDLAVYRVLQETLSSAAGEGARAASVVIAYADDELRLEIRDDRPTADSPAEEARDPGTRLGLYGGSVRAERPEDGPGQRLLARLPLRGVSA